MPKTKISEFSATPANNTDIDSINIAEGCAPSGINDAIRELMAQLKDFQTGAVGDSFNGPVGTSTAAAGAFTTLSASGTATLSGLTASTALALDASKNIVSVTNTGTGSNVLATSPTLVTPILGTPTSATLTNATGLPISTGVSGLGTGIATALAVNTGSAGAPVLFNGALGTPSGGTVTNLTGTASININGTVGATTASTGAFTTLAASGAVTLSGGTANGVTYLNGSKVLTSGSALTFDGSQLLVKGNERIYFNTFTNSTTYAGYIGRNTSTGNFEIGSQTIGGNYPIDFFVGTQASMKLSSSGVFNFYDGSGGDRMVLNSTGLGIGTSSPAYKLDVRVTGTGNVANFQSDSGPNIRFTGTETSGRTYQLGEGLVTAGSFSVYDTTGSAERLVINSSGNLGLGVTPSAWTAFKALQVNHGSLTATTGNNTVIASNAFYDGAWKYISTDFATYSQTVNGQYRWYTAASGTAGNAITFTQAMTLDASGNLGVGTTSPSQRIHASAADPRALLASTGTGHSAWQCQNTSGSSYFGRDNAGGSFFGTSNATVVYSSSADPIIFYTNATERARIDSSGNFLVGVTSGSVHTLSKNNSNDIAAQINNTSSSNCYGLRIQTTAVASNSASFYLLRCADSSATRADIRADGGLANYSANNANLSDQRVKTDIQNAGGYLAKICAIPVRTFKYKNQTDDLLNLGCIAQEVEAVAPELVDASGFGETPEDGVPLKAIYQTDLQYALMKALQELKAEFDAYKASHP